MGDELFNTDSHQHIRYNPLNGSWILVSPHRMKRPWMGQLENVIEDNVPEFDPQNPLCPGVVRASGEKNPDYESTHVFRNDFPALLETGPCPPESEEALFQIRPAFGVCRVMCFHPKSNITVPMMTIPELVTVINEWIKQYDELGRRYCWVQIFENKGPIMGCSNPHPHCQIWASSFMPNEVRIKDFYQMDYYKKNNRPLLLDYVAQEIEKQERVVIDNDDWVVVVPYWAVWPYETYILPKTHVKRMSDLSEEKKETLASIMKRLTTRYDNLFKCNFPYSMGFHGAPSGPKRAEESTHWVLHAIYYPPLLRCQTIKKFMVGYEMLANVQRDLTPEQAAETLRALPETPLKPRPDPAPPAKTE